MIKKKTENIRIGVMNRYQREVRFVCRTFCDLLNFGTEHSFNGN